MAEQNFQRRFFRKPDDGRSKYNINLQIRAKFVRVVGENVEPGILPIQDALRMAEDLGLDLVEISPTADPPVCKVVDLQKFLYQQKKKLKEQKAKTVKVIIKEIRFGPNTDDHDFNFKLKHAIKFIEEGAKVKAFVFFKGRSIMYNEQGKKLLEKFAAELEDYAKIEQYPKLEGKRMFMILTPKPKK
ncbi:MAG: translation initiation factor IF-3 [Bacteroidetes bacterium GWA2_31_9]|nr:MAG: translation initiation factor IF-3 [Bacteroidetes bacterium GWA2_31_9]